jgi:hypothetical protein
MIKYEIERVPDERLEELYGVVKSYARDESSDESERARKFKAAADAVFESRKSV